MKTPFKQIQRMPYFPFFPFVPIVVAGGLIALEAFTLARLRRLGRRLDELSLVAQRVQPV